MRLRSIPVFYDAPYIVAATGKILKVAHLCPTLMSLPQCESAENIPTLFSGYLTFRFFATYPRIRARIFVLHFSQSRMVLDKIIAIKYCVRTAQ